MANFDFKITQIDINSIMPYKDNAKKHNKQQIDNVAESIKQFGFVQPIVVDKNNVIVIGQKQLKALKTACNAL